MFPGVSDGTGWEMCAVVSPESEMVQYIYFSGHAFFPQG